MAEQSNICPVCGERDPYPKWFCMFRAAGVAIPGEPCSYSLEGEQRAERLGLKSARASSGKDD